MLLSSSKIRKNKSVLCHRLLTSTMPIIKTTINAGTTINLAFTSGKNSAMSAITTSDSDMTLSTRNQPLSVMRSASVIL